MKTGNTTDRSGGFRFIDLFAGIGGLRRPFETIGGRCVFTAEWDRFSRETYSANFPEPADSDHIFAEDVRPYANAPEQIPAHDVLLAGFPCQPFSIAGVSKKNALGYRSKRRRPSSRDDLRSPSATNHLLLAA